MTFSDALSIRPKNQKLQSYEYQEMPTTIYLEAIANFVLNPFI